MITENTISEMMDSIKKQVGSSNVSFFMPYSAVSFIMAKLVGQAIGKQLKCLFWNHEFFTRKQEEMLEQFAASFEGEWMALNMTEQIYDLLKDVTDSEIKRKIVSDIAHKMADEKLEQLDTDFLLIDLTYEDKEDYQSMKKPIASGKNILMPFIDFTQEEVIEIGKLLGIPEISYVPSEGLVNRILGTITEEKVDVLKKATEILDDEMSQLSIDVDRYFFNLLSIKTEIFDTAQWSEGFILVLRVVKTNKEVVRAEVVELPYDFIKHLTERVMSEVTEVGRVLYDYTPKPKASIELFGDIVN